MTKRRFRQIRLATNAEITAISSEALAERLFVDVDNDQLYYIDENGAPQSIKGTGSGVTNLSIANRDSTTLDVASDTGTDATIPAATTLLSGLMTGADKTNLDTNTAHTSNTANPHNTDLGNLGSGTLAELNALVTDATLDDSSATRTPSAHTHTIADVDFDANFVPSTGSPDIGSSGSRVNTIYVVDINATGNVDGRDVSLDGAKLDTIEASAEVNNISDANATDLTDGGDSTLHYHSADRNRANHTGTQTASTISDFDTEVSNNTSVTANTAKVSADGSINTHSDVDTTGLANGDILRYDGSDFVPLVIRKGRYTNSSGTTAITTTAKTLVLNTTQKTTGTGDFTLASNELTIKNADDYDFWAHVALNDTTTSSRSSFTVYVQHYNGSTWSNITGVLARAYIRGTSDAQSVHLTGEITAAANDKIRIMAVRANGSGTAFQVNGYTSFYIKTQI